MIYPSINHPLSFLVNKNPHIIIVNEEKKFFPAKAARAHQAKEGPSQLKEPALLIKAKGHRATLNAE